MDYLGDREKRNKDIDRLVLLSQHGDTECFAKLYDIFIVPVYRYIYYRVGKEDAEDLTELVFLKIWERLSQYRKQQCSFAAWLFKVARNVVIDHYRSQTSYVELDDSIPDGNQDIDPLRQAELSFSKETLQIALSRIKELYQQVIVLKFINDFSNAEIAHILGRKEGNIRVLQFRALQSLKDVLGKMHVDIP
jgi:RNA polymerase sigma-70 factor (ECF subfamily)